MPWSAASLSQGAVAISASRRTDIPAWYGPWFLARLEAGEVEYVPIGPPRRVRRSLRPEDVTHFCFWSKSPRPFLPVLRRVLDLGYPVLWNVTITGLGGTEVEPRIPAASDVVAAVAEIARMVPPAAIQWRYDPVFLSRRYDARYHEEAFSRLVEALAGKVDRIAASFVEPFPRIRKNLAAYKRTNADSVCQPSLQEQTDLISRLREIAAPCGLALTLCCSPELCERIPQRPGSGCNSWDWACRVYPDLRRHRVLRAKPTRLGCLCAAAWGIGHDARRAAAWALLSAVKNRLDGGPHRVLCSRITPSNLTLARTVRPLGCSERAGLFERPR